MKKILVISNDFIFLSNQKIYSRYNDTINILESINQKFNIDLISRKSYKKENFFFKIKGKISRFELFANFFNRKKIKIFMISITPRNLFYFIILNFFNYISGYVYLRSDGFKEYENKTGIVGYFFYLIMLNFLKSRLKIISVTKHLKNVKAHKFLKPSELEKIWFLNQKKPKLDLPRLLYFGRFRKEKGVYSLIRLVKNLKIKFKLTLAGDKKSDGYNNFLNINFYSEISSKKKILKLFDDHNIFILPSYTEGYPKVILESLARLRPVIIFKEIKHVKSKFYGVFMVNRDSQNLEKMISFIIKNYKKIQTRMKKNELPTRKTFQKDLQAILSA